MNLLCSIIRDAASNTMKFPAHSMMATPNGAAAEAFRATGTRDLVMDGSCCDGSEEKAAKVPQKLSNNAPNNELLSCSDENITKNMTPTLPNDAFLQQLTTETPESTRDWHKELLFGLFSHSDDAEMSRWAHLAGTSITRQLPPTRHDLAKSSAEPMDVTETGSREILESMISRQADCVARKRSRIELEWNKESSSNGNPSKLSLIPHVLLQEQSKTADVSSNSPSTCSPARRGRKRQRRPMVVQGVDQLERIVQDKFVKSTVGQQATAQQAGRLRPPMFEPFSLEYNECSMSGIAAWALQSESPTVAAPPTTGMQVPAPSVMFRKCGCCHKWGHFETECKELDATDTIELCQQLIIQQMKQESVGKKPTASSFANFGPSNVHVTCDVCHTAAPNHDLLYCHSCSRSFHSECLQYPVSVPLEPAWQCQECRDEVQSQVSSAVDIEGCDGFVIEQCKRKRNIEEIDGVGMQGTSGVLQWGFLCHGWSSAVGIQSYAKHEKVPDVDEDKLPSELDLGTAETLVPGDLCWTRYKGEDRNPLSERDNWWPSVVISVDSRRDGKPFYVVKLFKTLLSRVKTNIVLPFLLHFERLGYDRVNGDDTFDRFRDDAGVFSRALDSALAEIGCMSLAFALKKAQHACGANRHASKESDEKLLEVHETWDDAEETVQDGFLIRAKRDPSVDHAEHCENPNTRLAGSIVAWFPHAIGVDPEQSSTQNSMLVGMVRAANLGDGMALVQNIPNWRTVLATRDDSFVLKAFSLGATVWLKMKDLHLVSSGAPLAVQGKFSNDLLPKRLNDERERLRSGFLDARLSPHVDGGSEFASSTSSVEVILASTGDRSRSGSPVNGAVPRSDTKEFAESVRPCQDEADGPSNRESQDDSSTVDVAKQEESAGGAPAATMDSELPTSNGPNSDVSSPVESSPVVRKKSRVNEIAWRQIDMDDRPSKEWMRRLLRQVEGNNSFAQNHKAIATRFKYRIHPSEIRFCTDTNEWKFVSEDRLKADSMVPPETIDLTVDESTDDDEEVVVVADNDPLPSATDGRSNSASSTSLASSPATKREQQLNEIAWRRIDYEKRPSVEWKRRLLRQVEGKGGFAQNDKAIVTRFQRKLHPDDVRFNADANEWKLINEARIETKLTTKQSSPEYEQGDTGPPKGGTNRSTSGNSSIGDKAATSDSIARDASNPSFQPVLSKKKLNERAWSSTHTHPSIARMKNLLHSDGFNDDGLSQTDTAIRSRFKRHFHPSEVAYNQETDEWNLVDTPETAVSRRTAEKQAVVAKKPADSPSGRANEKEWQHVLVTDMPPIQWMSRLLKQCVTDEGSFSQSDTAIRSRFKRKIRPEHVLYCEETTEWKLNPESDLQRTNADHVSTSDPNKAFRPLHQSSRNEKPPAIEATPVARMSEVANGSSVQDDLVLTPAERAKLRTQREKPSPYDDNLTSPAPPQSTAANVPSPVSLGVFRVEDILDDRQVTTARGGNKRTEYLIKWKGYDVKDCTWERKDNILDPWLVERYQVRKAYNKLAAFADSNQDDATFQLVLHALKVGKERMERHVIGSGHVAMDRIVCPYCRKVCSAKNPTPFAFHMNTHAGSRNLELLKEAAQVIREEWYNGL